MSQPADHLEAAALEAVRLRRQMEQGAEYSTSDPWSVTLPDDLDTQRLHHLPPPRLPEAVTDPRVARWLAAFQPALCYYRRGPGFIAVKDLREPDAEARIVIDQEPLIDAFLRCEEPVRLADETGNVLAALEFLLQENLLLRFGGVVTTAPYHMRRWPIPARFA